MMPVMFKSICSTNGWISPDCICEIESSRDSSKVSAPHHEQFPDSVLGWPAVVSRGLGAQSENIYCTDDAPDPACCYIPYMVMGKCTLNMQLPW